MGRSGTVTFVALTAAALLSALMGCASTATPQGPATVTVTSAPTTPVPSNFVTVNELVDAVAPLGVPCPGRTEGPKQRSCTSELNMTVWADPSDALRQARQNVRLLDAGSIVIGNGMISAPVDDPVATQALMAKLAPLHPTLIDTP